jgi:hypothetical protein
MCREGGFGVSWFQGEKVVVGWAEMGELREAVVGDGRVATHISFREGRAVTLQLGEHAQTVQAMIKRTLLTS